MTVLQRAERNIDRASVERARGVEDARVSVVRQEFLYGRLFRNVVLDRDVGCLRTENAAIELLRAAGRAFDNRRQVQILRAAVDNRWPSVVNAFIKSWDGEHPIAGTVQELWDLTSGRDSA